MRDNITDCRGGHWPSVFIGIYLNQKVYMIWHNYIMVYVDRWIYNMNLIYKSVHDSSNLGINGNLSTPFYVIARSDSDVAISR